MTLAATAAKAIPAVAVLLLLLAGSSARAQQPSQDQIAAVRASCRSDFMAHCSGVQPGGKDALDCLKRNLAKLSGSCQTAVNALTPPSPPANAAPAAAAPPPAARPQTPAAAAAPPAAVAPPVAARPPTYPAAKLTPPAPATPVEGSVSPPSAVAPQAPGVMVLPPREALRIVRICAVDRQALCAGVPPGGGRIIACLMRNQAALSPPCRDALAMAQSR